MSRRAITDIMGRVMAVRGLFASTQRSLTQLCKHYSDQDLVVIVDFLKRNAERLRAETRKLDAATLDKAEAVFKGMLDLGITPVELKA